MKGKDSMAEKPRIIVGLSAKAGLLMVVYVQGNLLEKRGLLWVETRLCLGIRRKVTQNIKHYQKGC